MERSGLRVLVKTTEWLTPAYCHGNISRPGGKKPLGSFWLYPTVSSAWDMFQIRAIQALCHKHVSVHHSQAKTKISGLSLYPSMRRDQVMQKLAESSLLAFPTCKELLQTEPQSTL